MPITRRNVLATLPIALAGLARAASGAASPSRALLGALGGTPLGEVESFLAAVRAGDEHEVRRRLAGEPSLAAARDEAGVSALVHAHLAGQPHIAALLCATGLELDIVECVFEEDWKRLDALAKSDPAAADRLYPIGGNLLYAGALAGSSDLYRLRALGAGRDAAPSGGSGFTPARAAMDQRTLEGARIAATDLLGNGSDANTRQRGGDSVLHGAVRRRSEILVRLAVRKGADVEARDDAGRTALALARELGWAQGVALLADQATLPRDHRASRFLFDANREPVRRPDLADVPQVLQNRVTGSSHMNPEGLRALVEPDPRLCFSISTDDELAIEASAHVGNHELMRFHLDHGAPLSLPTAASLGDTAMIRFLLERDPLLVHERGAHDFPLLHYAAIGGGGVEIAALLHEHGAAVDQETMGLTTLHWSVRHDLPDLTVWLIEHGADVEAVAYKWERQGETPLAVALADQCERQIRILRDAGARG